ncbi:formylmethanofuran dehydrogenase, subunit D [Geoglobus ahangari]|uniref:Formylmethanofuran dehydrogenase, subunit D n=1 Tax=Geoglobus ahangari TaxID=113653 RepID=A0A0F7IEV4_9EURY|nr:hypothetical protein [Geoglobus ahangari]AKG91547.1 formylmethanofuran dehydrogenase, subunit D [Geoglobus ahangari]
MPLQFSKFLKKITVEVVVARSSFQVEAMDKGKFTDEYVEKSAVIYFTEEFAKSNGLKEGDVVRVTRAGRSVNVKVAISDVAPSSGAFMPNSIYTSYLTDFDSFKRFEASIEPVSGGSVTKPEEIMQIVLNDS